MDNSKFLTIKALLELLCVRFPSCFVLFEQRRRPLKIGIHLDILAEVGDAIKQEELSEALRCYTHNQVYRSRLIAGATRVDLNGLPAGFVTEKQEASAKKRCRSNLRRPSQRPKRRQRRQQIDYLSPICAKRHVAVTAQKSPLDGDAFALPKSLSRSVTHRYFRCAA